MKYRVAGKEFQSSKDAHDYAAEVGAIVYKRVIGGIFQPLTQSRWHKKQAEGKK